MELDFEKLGMFYLGRNYDLAAGESKDETVLYDSKDLTTHAVVVGMTGSGKTGLCLDLLEEAGLDRIPALIIDPKGDIANLLLTFPGLSGEEFRPWIDESQAMREGVTPDQFAQDEAAKWKSGLAQWGQDGERIRRLRDTVEMRIYTPGSDSGRPVAILKSFAAPGKEVLEDTDALRERIAASTSGLLALLGIDADPIRSKEHILISKILETAWLAGRDLDIARLIHEIQNPPFEKVGVIELDLFFPPKDRVELSMTLNNLLASPTFASWLQGEPLDIKRMLHTPEGKPCISILSIAHLSEAERMFFVTIVLNEVLSWMRSQPGTASLRAILYMDEVFGYFPPTKNPPSKQPMLTLLKQARAYGLGCVLATQNPVDLDYKGLSNTGTWFLGRLQTERDKMRVLEGLEGAAAQVGSTFDRSEMEQTLAGLGSRRFLMNNVHEDQPVVFETRWAMSYLRGPLTRAQIRTLVKQSGAVPPPQAANSTSGAIPRPSAPKSKKGVGSLESGADPRRVIPKEIPQQFLDIAHSLRDSDRVVYRPALAASARMHFSKSPCKIDDWFEKSFLAPVFGAEVPDEVWEKAEAVEETMHLDEAPRADAEFATIPDALQNKRKYASWKKELKDQLYREEELIVWKCAELKECSTMGESQGDFRVRLEQKASEKRDAETEKLRKRFASKFKTMQGRIDRAEEKIEREKSQYKQRRLDSILSVGSTILGAVLGRKRMSRTNVNRASSSMKTLGRAGRERSDIGRAEDNLELLQEQFQELEAEFESEIQGIEDKLDVASLDLEEIRIRPRKTDLSVDDLRVVWLPFRVDANGIAEPVY